MLNIRNRALMLAVALVSVFAFATSAYAQEGTFGLSEEDFALWTSANGASTAFSALDYSFVADATVTSEGESFAVTLNGNGVIDAATGALTLDIDGSIDGLGAVDVSLRLVGDTLFISGIDGTDTWYSVSDAELQDFQDQAGDLLPFDPDALASGDPSALGLDEDAQMEVFNAAFGLIESLPNYVTVTREADAAGEAVFVTEFMLADFVSDPNLETLVATGIASEGTVSFEDAQAQAAEAMGAAAMVMAGSELSYTQNIDTATNMVNQGILALLIDSEMLGLVVDVNFDVTINEYDPAVSVEAPAESTPISELTGALAG